VSWAAHEFENYFFQKHFGTKASFLAICTGTYLPDVFTKHFVYQHQADAAQFHRGWPGLGFTHSLTYGFVVAVLILAVTKSRAWALGILIGQWAHVITDISDTAGVMAFFPFSTDNLTIGMWKHAAAEGRGGDGAAYYSGLGGIWDFFWMLMVLVFAGEALRADYFRRVVVPTDPKVWAFLGRRLYLNDNALLVFYRGLFLYGVGRMIVWFIYARFQVRTPWQPVWGGPLYVPGNHLNHGSAWSIAGSLAIGAVAFALFVYLSWVLVVRRLWERAGACEAASPNDTSREALETVDNAPRTEYHELA
jgi:membrane-bound metal-dependent hydrolase YbcI (DUF457 family)